MLEQLKQTEKPIRDAFEGVGATRPVELTRAQKITLVQIIESWASERGGYDGIPAGIGELRTALLDDLLDTRQGQQ